MDTVRKVEYTFKFEIDCTDLVNYAISDDQIETDEDILQLVESSVKEDLEYYTRNISECLTVKVSREGAFIDTFSPASKK